MAEQTQNSYQRQHLFQNAKSKGAFTSDQLERGREGAWERQGERRRTNS
jgi:hypothetical protein